MQLRFLSHLPANPFNRSRASQQTNDLEMGSLVPRSATSLDLDLRALTHNAPLLTKVYEASTGAFNAGHTAQPKAKTNIWTIKVIAPMLLLAPAALTGATIGVSFLATPIKTSAFTACRASVCQGFARPTYAILGGGNEHWGSTQHSLKKACLSHFETGYYDALDGFVTFHRILEQAQDGSWHAIEACPAPTAEDLKIGPNLRLRGRIEEWAITGGVALQVAVIAGVVAYFHPARRPLSPALDDGLRAFLSPRLYTLAASLPTLTPEAQRDACRELMPILHQVLAQSVERFDMATVDALLELGVAPNVAAPGSTSALQQSLTLRNDVLTAKLIAYAYDLTAADLDAAARVSDVGSTLAMVSALETHRGLTPERLQTLYATLPDDFLFELCSAKDPTGASLMPLLTRLGPAAYRLIAATDAQGRTPLHLASYWKQTDALESLRSFGADATLRDAFGKTAEELAELGDTVPDFIAH